MKRFLGTLLAIVIFYGAIYGGGQLIKLGADPSDESYDDNPVIYDETIAEREREEQQAALDDYEYLQHEEEIQQLIDDNHAMPWDEAEKHIGEYVTIYGYVSAVTYEKDESGEPIFVDIGGTYPDNRVTGVCWSEYHSNFENLEQFEGETVFMEGTLYEYNGVPNIELTDGFQIRKME